MKNKGGTDLRQKGGCLLSVPEGQMVCADPMSSVGHKKFREFPCEGFCSPHS